MREEKSSLRSCSLLRHSWPGRSNDIFCRHINYLWARNINTGYTDNTYRPNLSVRSADMAGFLVNGFNLQFGQ